MREKVMEDKLSSAGLKPGTQVVMRKSIAGEHKDVGIRVISRLTPTQIILAPEGTYDRYHRCHGTRTFPGKNISGMGLGWIDRVATPDEIEQWGAEKRKKDAAWETLQTKRQAQENKRDDLCSMFSESVAVRSGVSDTWEVEFGSLTEAQVRRLAELVKGEL